MSRVPPKTKVSSLYASRYSKSHAILVLAWIVPLCLLTLSFGPNWALALYSSFILALGTLLLWREAEPPILFVVFLFQWIQASAGVFYANILALPVGDIAKYGGQQDMAIFLLLSGVLILAITIRLTIGPPIPSLYPRVQAFVSSWPYSSWVSIFAIAWLFSATCAAAAPIIGGLELPLFTMSQIHWAAFVLLTLATFSVPGRPKGVWLAIFAFEFVLSVGGYFSTFKDVFIYALIGLSASRVRLNVRVVLPAVFLAGILLCLSLVWTAIKGDYRAFVNAGTGQQVVTVDYISSVSELVRLASDLNLNDISDAADLMVRRFMYFEYFGVVLDQVPYNVPHANGEIWTEAVIRVFTPRLLFPNKRAINDSDLTNYYTNLELSTDREGASISIGYIAEAYIDFGYAFMMIPIAALGALLGLLYRWLLTRSGNEAVLGMSLAPFALMPALFLETSVLKLVPALGLSGLACLVVLKVLGSRVFGLNMGREG